MEDLILAVRLIACGRGREQRKNFEIDTPTFVNLLVLLLKSFETGLVSI